MIDHLVCSECPNGCRLSIEWKDGTNVLISQNKCSRGLGYAARILRQQKKVHVTAKEKMPVVSEITFKEIALLWGIKIKKIRQDVPVQGSPERSAFRMVAEDEEQNRFVLEQLFLKTLTTKKNIAKTLELLAQRKLAHIRPYKIGLGGEPIVKYRSSFWQMADFVPGVELDRSTYMFEPWRGPLLAQFLIDLRMKAGDIPFLNTSKVFSLKDYVYRLVDHIKMYQGSLQEGITPIMDFLEKEWIPFYEEIPVCFCHGDYHPMNVIWSKRDIQCVIDWEFSGYKSEIYDVANLVGCLGIEHPSALTGELVICFIGAMKKAQIISAASWKSLPAFIVALRFAWLSEWLRRKDEEMITLELDYMHLLIKNKKVFCQAWNL